MFRGLAYRFLAENAWAKDEYGVGLAYMMQARRYRAQRDGTWTSFLGVRFRGLSFQCVAAETSENKRAYISKKPLHLRKYRLGRHSPLRNTYPLLVLASLGRHISVPRGLSMSRSRSAHVPCGSSTYLHEAPPNHRHIPFPCAHAGLFSGLQIRGGEARRCERGLATPRRTAAKHRQRSQNSPRGVQGTP